MFMTTQLELQIVAVVLSKGFQLRIVMHDISFY